MKMKIILYFILLLISGGFGQSFARNVTETNSLSFGNVFTGIPKIVSKYTPGTAAEYLIQGTAGAEVTIDFALPTYMSLGGSNMQMIFREDDCSMDSSASYDQTNPGYDDLDPWHQITYRLGSNGLRVWLGGTLVPGLRQTEGSYSANIVITVAYTGG